MGGAGKIFRGVPEDFLGGAGKAEDPKPPGAGIPSKPCPMERAERGKRCTKREEPAHENPGAKDRHGLHFATTKRVLGRIAGHEECGIASVSGRAFLRLAKRGASHKNVSNARSTGKGQGDAHGAKRLAPFRKENERAGCDRLSEIHRIQDLTWEKCLGVE